MQTHERIVLAGRSGLLRAAHASVLRDAGFDVVAEADDGGALLSKVRAHRPDVAIVDDRRGGARDDELVEAVRLIRDEPDGVAVLLLGHDVDAAMARALVHAGAEGTGYLLERRVADVERYARAIREVASGGSVVEPELITHIIGPQRGDDGLEALDDRDREVLARLAAGATNRAIAQRMFLSERAIERHVTTIFDALGIGPCRRNHRRVLAALTYLRTV
jgi:DNA-binding NarL/FixJ family response regulator